MDDNLEKYKELNELTAKILSYVVLHKNKVPQGYAIFRNSKITNVEEALALLEVLFKEEEKEIAIKQQRTFVTSDYEDGVRTFAVSIIRILFPEHDKLKKYNAYRRLLVQKHMAYAFFHVLNNNLFSPGIKLDYSEFCEGLYLGLVEFYMEFYGNFSDNEEAIELLCKYFPEAIDEEKHKNKIASALYMHISNAGTPGDKGYAFHGIEQIEKYIKKLPVSIVYGVLKEYQVHFISNNDVYRHQVYTIINYSQIDSADKPVCKFRLLDSVILAQCLSPYFEQKLKNEFAIKKISSVIFETNFITDKIEICMNPNAYWSNGELGERVFYLNNNPIARVTLRNTKYIEVSNMDEKGNSEVLIFPYSYTDWLLEYYRSKEVEQKLRWLILGTENHYNQMIFSLLYLDNYRGMKNQVIDFNHRFQYERAGKQLKRKGKDLCLIESFYGRSVQTLSCIVGKNGMGKTSIIDFLRESFFKMLRLIEDYGISCEKGYVKESDYLEYNILDGGVRFLVVFQLGEKAFFLTNFSGVSSEGAEPFRAGIYTSVNEFSKVAYFSNMLKNNQDIFFVGNEKRVNNKQIQEKREIGRSLKGFRQVDYSETESFIRRQKAIILAEEREKGAEEGRKETGSVNRELCYQLTFLRNINSQKVCEYLDISEDKVFRITSRMNGGKEEDKDNFFRLKDLKDPERAEQLEKRNLLLSDAQIQYFSSGQYAKFAFLAKLYWFLEGYRREIERYRDIVGENEFRSEDALLEEETALIFIDEGETYYHPEWQRRYVKTLLEMINYEGNSSRVQIVITTNSPFILSDVLKDDVTYLAGESENCFDCTLGQNIHRLLKENFFMDYTIGEYARELIENIMICLENPGSSEEDNKKEAVKKIILRYYGKEKEIYSAMKMLIEQIGEPVYRYELEKLLRESRVIKEHRRMEQLLEEKRRIEEEIESLEKKG